MSFEVRGELAFVDRVHRSERQVDAFLLAANVPGQTVKPILLSRALHQEQRSGKEWESDKVRRAVLFPELEDSDSAKGNGGHRRVSAQLWVNVCVPAAHVVAVAIQVHETRVEVVPGHGNQTMQQIQKLRCPVQILFQI